MEWQPVIIAGVAAVVAPLVGAPLFAWMLRRRDPQGERGAGAVVMRFPRAWDVPFVVLLVVTWGGIGVAVWSAPERLAARPADGAAVLGIVLLLTALAVGVMVFLRRVAHQVGSEGFLVVEPFRRRRMLRWSEMTEVHFDAGRRWWRIRTADDAFWVPEALSGSSAFARAVLEHVPAHALERRAGTRELLERAAAGADVSAT